MRPHFIPILHLIDCALVGAQFQQSPSSRFLQRLHPQTLSDMRDAFGQSMQRRGTCI
jgi:hypothetical protein